MRIARISRLARWTVPAIVLAVHASASAAPLVVNARRIHLGAAGSPEWDSFAGDRPEARRLDLDFSAAANARENTLLIRQDDVRQDWAVELNGRRLGKLFLMEADLWTSFAVPPGAVRDGGNILSIVPPTVLPIPKPGANDDIVLHEIVLDPRPAHEALHESKLVVRVSDAADGRPVPCRITIVDGHGALVALPATAGGSDRPSPERPTATRPGVVYTGNGAASISLRAGDYTVFVSRGFEWSAASKPVHLDPGQTVPMDLAIEREVPTPGLVSCDTHVHTLTHSGHGDSTIDERMLTIAGEGIELPIATDHNFHADYAAPAKRLGVAQWFTPVGGNEVTTPTGHFNIFPVDAGARVPRHQITDWPELMTELRATPGVRVVILNHPRNVHNGFQPFAAAHFNAATGENRRGADFTFGAIEVLNSSAQQSDFMLVYRDWFALLNQGYRVPGVGSSDSHDVSRYIIGQGRTYIKCPDDDPARLDVATACSNLLAGRSTVSMGLLVQMAVDDKFGLGDVATGLGGEMAVRVEVLGPSWVRATHVTLFANGFPIREHEISGPAAGGGDAARGRKALVNWSIPRPARDVFLVALATGPAVTAPFWAIPKPYQPTSTHWEGRVIGITNPIRVDADGDRDFTPARSYAKRLVAESTADAPKLLAKLAEFDEAVAVQAASLCPPEAFAPGNSAWTTALESAVPHVRRGFATFAASRGDPPPK